MENNRIFESLLLLNDRIEGLLARIDFYSLELQKQLGGIMTLSDSKRKAILKDQKLMAEYFPPNQRESVKALLKPVVETLHQVRASEVEMLAKKSMPRCQRFQAKCTASSRWSMITTSTLTSIST